MSKNVINIQNNANNQTKGYPLFLGEDLGFADTINVTYPELAALYEEQRSQYWIETEHDLSQDKLDFKTCDQSVAEVMILNLMSQWLMDSVAARSIMSLLEPFTTNNELVEVLSAWSFYECLTPEHEVLTSEGWKSIAEVTRNDLVAQYAPGAKVISFVNPTGTVVKPFKGDMIKFTSQLDHLRQVVTPNHRMVVEYPYPLLRGKKEHFRLASELNLHGGNALPTAGVKADGDWVELTALQAFYVAVQADGHLPPPSYTGSRVGTIPYRFTLVKERKVLRLKEICEALGLEMKPYSSQADKYVINVPLSIHRPDIKSFDWIDLTKVTSVWGEAFIQELAIWDGYDPSRRNPKLRFKKYISTNKSCVEKAQMVGALSGFTTHISTNEATPGRIESYCLSFTPRKHISGNTINKEAVAYDGNVYCITVPSGAFVTRLGDSVSITGNCIHSRTYSFIMRQCFDDANAVLERAKANKNVAYRSAVIGKVFNEMVVIGAKYSLGQITDINVIKKAILKTICAVYALESISFMGSFACTFALTETGKFQAIGNDITAICKDEILHAKFGKTILDILLYKEGYLPIFDEFKEEFQEIFVESMKQEFSFNSYIFSEGRKVLGLTTSLLNDYDKFQAKPIFDCYGFEWPEDWGDAPLQNPLRYMDKYVKPDTIQSAAQEITLTNYRIGQVTDDTNGMTFDF